MNVIYRNRATFVLLIALSPTVTVHSGVTNPDISVLGQVLLSNPADPQIHAGNGAGPGRRIEPLLKRDVHFLDR
jgi:hypothetical protein